jgi:hypothetical protein
MQFGENMTFVPEALVAYDLKATRYYSGALDQTSGNVRDLSGATGYATEMKHSGRVLLRLNLLVKAGNTRYTIVPYAGYQSGVTVGGNVGAIF